MISMQFKAFKYSAIDYLLKPIDPDDLMHAIEKVTEKLSLTNMAQKLDVLYYNLQNKNKQSTRICLPVVNGLIFLHTHEIIRCESNINYTTIFLKDKQKHTVAKTLKEFDEMLAEHNFFRIHNSHLINLDYIKSYNKGKGGVVIMHDGTEIEVSTRRKDDFLKKLTA